MVFGVVKRDEVELEKKAKVGLILVVLEVRDGDEKPPCSCCEGNHGDGHVENRNISASDVWEVIKLCSGSKTCGIT